MKKNICFLLAIFTLFSCSSNVSSSLSSSSLNLSSSSVARELNLEDVILSIKNNFTVNYTSSNGSYNVYRTKDYFYDEELNGGQFVIYDDTMYVYTMHNNVVIPRVPFSGYRENFDSHYPIFNLDMTKFEVENDVYYTEDENNLIQLGMLINSTPYAKAAIYLDNGLLNFRFYNKSNKVVVTGKVYGVNATKVDVLDNYIEDRIDPETQTFENKELIEALGALDDNYTFIGQNNTNKSGLTLLVNEGYVATFTGIKDDYEDYYGYISLEDGLHEFNIIDDKVNVDFEIVGEKDFINDYKFKRHDFSKFFSISDKTYISSDSYNVRNFCDLLTADIGGINLVKLVINDDGSVDISLMSNYYEVYTGVIFNINNSYISSLDDFINGNNYPDLEHYANTKLVEATKNLAKNFTYVNQSVESEEERFFGVYSNEDGRKEYKNEYNNFPSTDYIIYDDYAYEYVLDEYKVSPLYYEYLSIEEYNSFYSFESIDFTHFIPIGENKWMTNSKKYMNILSKLLGSNPYEAYHYQAFVELIDGVLYFEITDSYFGTNTKGYLENINNTNIEILSEYKSSYNEPARPDFSNEELIDYINPLRDKTNFTVQFHDDPEFGMYFDETSYDYWTEDIVYFGFYEAGFITSSKSKYVYEFVMDVDEETKTKNLLVSSMPSLYLNTISDYNPFTKISNEQINSFLPYNDSSYISYDEEIVQIFVDVLQLGEDSLLGYSAVILDIINDELIISIVDVINVTYDENGKRNEKCEVFASATIKDVGTTSIPSFAIIPDIK